MPAEAFDVGEAAHVGRIEFGDGPIEINAGREAKQLVIVNTGDRPVQVGAHYHLFEANRALAFDREAAFGFRLDIPSGSAIRFEPGQSRKCDVVRFGGAEVVDGHERPHERLHAQRAQPRAVGAARTRAGYCFEGERFNVTTRADERHGEKGKRLVSTSHRPPGLRRAVRADHRRPDPPRRHGPRRGDRGRSHDLR